MGYSQVLYNRIIIAAFMFNSIDEQFIIEVQTIHGQQVVRLIWQRHKLEILPSKLHIMALYLECKFG